jgi:hypothetical protein
MTKYADLIKQRKEEIEFNNNVAVPVTPVTTQVDTVAENA